MTHSPLKKLLLGVTGGIAAYKTAELTRLLVKQGIEVQVVMTEAACQFITPVTMQVLSGKRVFTSMWDASVANGMPHIELSRNADAILVAPASADFISKLVHGGADDLLSTMCLARDCLLMVAPAMNRQMWENPATQRNINQLRKDGVVILGPDSGDQACGETGMGRMLEPEQLLAAIEADQHPKILAGKRILITAGPTFEAIDPVRVITNMSSGKMGYSVAQAAGEMGAEVTLISGPTALSPPPGAKMIHVVSAQDMLNAVTKNIARQDIFISVAAIADYRPDKASKQKIKKAEKGLTLKLSPNIDILAKIASMRNAPFCVGFAAETESLLKHAEQKRKQKKLPLMAANLVQDALGKDNTALTLLDNKGKHVLPRKSKIESARLLLQHIAAMLKTSKTKAKP